MAAGETEHGTLTGLRLLHHDHLGIRVQDIGIPAINLPPLLPGKPHGQPLPLEYYVSEVPVNTEWCVTAATSWSALLQSG